MDVHTGNAVPQIPGGRYHIVERLSAGAVGSVYKALDTILDRPVAVKCIHLDTPFADQSPDELRERFVREARIAARLQHPNIVTIHDIVATADRGFIIMEFIEGMPLEALLADRRRLSMHEATRVISQLASALDYAHSRNVVHRDVKPVNILVSESLWVWVTDFGIAKSELSTNLTMAGGVLGTPDYMSPEQAKGEDVDARSDLFSLGCILFECVMGEKPFRSPSLTGVLLSIINDEPMFPQSWRSFSLPEGLKPILLHALEKDREKRYGSGAEMVKALEELGEAKTEESAASPAVAVVTEEAPAGAAEDAPEEPSDPSFDLSTLVSTSDADDDASAAEPDRDREESAAPERDREEAEPESPEIDEALLAAAAGEGEAEDESPDRTMMFAPEQVPPAPPPPRVDPARVEELKAETRPLRLSPNLAGELQAAVISPEEGFVLSRIDGQSRASEILAMSPMSEVETAAALLNLLDKDLIRYGGARTPAREAVSPAEPAKPKGNPDQATILELDRLLALAKSHAYAELLGIDASAPSGARKSAYLKIIGRFHPDKFPRAEDEIREKLSRICAEAAEAMEQLASPPAAPSTPSRPSNGSSFGASQFAGGSNGRQGPSFDKKRYARELYDRALRAFDTLDFWGSIQLCRQALETDDTQAEYFHLLGRALMQNKKWRKEAADNFRRASELEPANLAYLGMLGAVYKAEGLQARANAILKKAQTLDPSFTLPEIDGEPAVQAG